MRTADRFPRALVAIALAAFLTAAGVGCGGAQDEYAHQMLHALDQGKVMGTRENMQTLATAFNAYQLDRGSYPTVTTMPDAVAALSPAFLRAPLTADAWGNPFDYHSDGRSYTLTSPGGDGKVGTEDDLAMVDGRFTHLPTASPGAGSQGQ